MIKCPNCGSTAQVKILFHYKYWDGSCHTKYHCGCGCAFQTTENKNGLIKGEWKAEVNKNDTKV